MNNFKEESCFKLIARVASPVLHLVSLNQVNIVTMGKLCVCVYVCVVRETVVLPDLHRIWILPEH